MNKEIPKGVYCYDEKGVCPYWSIKEGREEQENGWCSYLGKGDIEIGKEMKVYDSDNKLVVDPPRFIAMGLLWDQCKECGINKDFEL